MPTELTRVFETFDGRHVAPLKELADCLDAEGVAVLPECLPGQHEVAATWVLKALAETARLPEEVAGRAFARLGRLTAPDAILHLLQIAQFHPDAARAALPEIRVHLGAKRVLLRVWALDAFVRVNPGREAEDLVAAGLNDPAASMRARARQLVEIATK